MAKSSDQTGQRGVIGPKPEDPSPPGVRSVIGPKPEDPHSIGEIAVPRAGGPGTKLPSPGGHKPG